ncbi:MAG: CPBP family intramembrane glutamic endopeptidase, partial [Planctomycetota bacterium]
PVRWSPGKWVIVVLSCIIPTAVGLLLAGALTYVIEPDPTAAALFAKIGWVHIIPYLAFIMFMPGFGEELLFRGYLQNRMHRRFGPVPTILCSGLIFGLIHVMPHTVVFASVLGIWFAFIAYKTGSVWPTIVCHAAVNGIWTILNVSISATGISGTAQIGIFTAIILIGIVPFALTFQQMKVQAPPVCATNKETSATGV